MSHRIKLLQSEKKIVSYTDETILSASLRNEVPYPHSCQNGRCGECKSRLISGDVEHLTHNKYTLTEKEKAEGIILACKAIPQSDVVVSWLASTHNLIAPSKIKTEIAVKEKLTHDTWRIVLKSFNGHTFNFLQGQFAQITFPDCPPRSYSMANQPLSDALEFYIREVPDGQVSSNLSKFQLGDIVEVLGPNGNAFLRKEHTGPILAVGGGSGIAPIKSIIEGSLLNGMRQKIHLYFGVREEHDVYLSEYFLTLARLSPNLSVNIVVDHAMKNSLYRPGRVTEAILQDFAELKGDWNVYLTGPPPMIESLTPLLIERGISDKNIWSDPFYSST